MVCVDFPFSVPSGGGGGSKSPTGAGGGGGFGSSPNVYGGEGGLNLQSALGFPPDAAAAAAASMSSFLGQAAAAANENGGGAADRIGHLSPLGHHLHHGGGGGGGRAADHEDKLLDRHLHERYTSKPNFYTFGHLYFDVFLAWIVVVNAMCYGVFSWMTVTFKEKDTAR